MRRRDFIKLIAGSAAVSPVVAHAQPSTVPVIGLVGTTSQAQWANNTLALRNGLKESGYVEGKNVAIEERWADGDSDRLPRLVADVINRRVNLIVTCGGTLPALAAKAATATIPIVFVMGGDPVLNGLVTSINRPGSNATGVSFLLNELLAKRLELLREIAPGFTSIGLLGNAKNANMQLDVTNFHNTARSLGLKSEVVTIVAANELEAAFNKLTQQRIALLSVAPDPVFLSLREKIVALAARNSMPATYYAREFVIAGGLMSHAPSITEAHRQGGIQAARVLKGASPANLPVMLSTRIELVINLKTAKTLGLTIPQTLQAAADEVIE